MLLTPEIEYDDDGNFIIAKTRHGNVKAELDAATKRYLDTISSDLVIAFKEDILKNIKTI